MQTTLLPARRKKAAYVLILTLFFLTASLTIFGGLLYWSSGNATQTARNAQYVKSQAAAEAATETVLATMMRDYLIQSLTNSSYYTTLLPNQNRTNSVWPVQYTFSDTNGTANQISVNLSAWNTNTSALTAQYSGLYGLVQNCVLTATATPIAQPYTVPATLSEGLQFASIPLFQYAIFYNINLEIDPGSGMTINGPVFSNAGIWAGSSACTFQSTVSAVDDVNTTTTDPFATNKSGSGTPTFSLAGQPVSKATPVKMPVGTNNSPAAVRAILQLPPPEYALGSTAAYTTNGIKYMANGADLYVTNAATGTNFMGRKPVGTNFLVYFQDGSQSAVPFDFFLMTNTATGGPVFSTNYATSAQLSNILNLAISPKGNVIIYGGYSFLTNSLFFDWREGWNGGSGIGGKGKAVQAVDIDIAKLNIWLTNSAATNSGYYINQLKITHKNKGINSVYVYNGVPATSVTLPAVRVINGTNLPAAGFTVATQFPMYVKGDYNITTAAGTQKGVKGTGIYTYPAALMADSVTILSGNWKDYNYGLKPLPTATTINAACLEGIVPSNPAINGNYSGGVENFLRLLEAWTGNIQLTYNGSIVVMFPSQYATNSYNGGYYGVPNRLWSFDTNFKQQSLLPPLCPQIKAVIRTQWNGQ